MAHILTTYSVTGINGKPKCPWHLNSRKRLARVCLLVSDRHFVDSFLPFSSFFYALAHERSCWRDPEGKILRQIVQIVAKRWIVLSVRRRNETGFKKLQEYTLKRLDALSFPRLCRSSPKWQTLIGPLWEDRREDDRFLTYSHFAALGCAGSLVPLITTQPFKRTFLRRGEDVNSNFFNPRFSLFHNGRAENLFIRFLPAL